VERSQPGQPPQERRRNSLKDPDVAFILEVLVGIAGVLGVGWMYSGNVRRGVLLIVSWWSVLAALIVALMYAARAVGVVGVLGILPAVMTVGVGGPVLSGFRVRRRLRRLHRQAQTVESREKE
jgi:hypothetical protein